jgi:hypothetical protein
VNRARVLIVAVVLVLFIAAGGALIFANRHAGQNRTIDITVTGAKTMSPPTWSANQNDTLTVNIKSDTDGEVHLHGYDIHFDTKAGQTLTQTFKADKSGSYDIEWENTSTPLGQLVVSP